MWWRTFKGDAVRTLPIGHCLSILISGRGILGFAKGGGLAIMRSLNGRCGGLGLQRRMRLAVGVEQPWREGATKPKDVWLEYPPFCGGVLKRWIRVGLHSRFLTPSHLSPLYFFFSFIQHNPFSNIYIPLRFSIFETLTFPLERTTPLPLLRTN